ncbi:hypothetical protein CDG81_16460 [Actinopolyspora erythraea]|uniref:Uncharacterized protein n=1 Tax=Actinopolyspora erythraea TaxID=414996 RepID=A0A223RUS1_9ACTN|nr:hypothetical protein CDG81_16460 [Actinopolyspora erythraea]
MDSTPIYTELRNTLIDPEGDHWTTSAPPEFVASLEGAHEQSDQPDDGPSGNHSAGTHTPPQQSRRSKGRRHRAED